MSAAPSRGLVGLFKKAWNEIPEVVGSSFFGLLGICITIYSVKLYYDKDGDFRRHRIHYTVIRDDDPRAEKARKLKYDS